MFIPVNLSALEGYEGNKRLALLIHVIQSYFYSSFEARKRSKKLYYYSIADESKTKSEEEKEKSISLNIDLKGKIPVLLSFILTIFVLFLSFLFPSYNIYNVTHLSILKKALLGDIQLYLALLSTFELFVYFIANWSKKENLSIELSGKNFNYLQMSFQQLLLTSNKIYIFVIDEIDKLSLKGQQITELFQDLKNLLTISSGRFIFISTEEYYDHITGEISDKNPYPISSTVFNSQIFISQARINDILNFLKSIVKNKNDKGDKILLLFAYYVYTMSGGVFAKVKNVIRDFLIYQDNKAHLILDEQKFDQNKRRIGRLGKIFDNIYKQSYITIQSEQRYQHKRHEALYAVLKEVIQLSTFGSKDFSITSLCELHGDRAFNTLTDKQKELIRNDIRDLLGDIKILATHGQVIPYTIPPNDIDVFTLSLTMNQIQANLENLPLSRNELTEIEKELKNEIKKLEDLSEKYNINLKYKTNNEVIYMLGEGIHAQYDAAVKLASEFAPLKIVSQQEVQNRIKEIKEIAIILNDELGLLQKYLITSLKGLEAAANEEVNNLLSNLGSQRINNILISPLLFKYGNDYLIVTKSDGVRINLYERLKKQKILPNIAVVLIKRDIKNQFIEIGFNSKKVKYSKIGSYLQGSEKLTEEIKKAIDWKSEQSSKGDINNSQTQSEVTKT